MRSRFINPIQETHVIKTRKISFGATAAVVTSMALVTGLGAADATRPVIVSALLIAAVADNLTDALSVHVFQESEHLDRKEVLAGTMTNFFTRLLLGLSFVLLAGWLPLAYATTAALIWGTLLLSILTYLVAHERGVNPLPEILIHLVVTVVVIAASMSIGRWINEVL